MFSQFNDGSSSPELTFSEFSYWCNSTSSPCSYVSWIFRISLIANFKIPPLQHISVHKPNVVLFNGVTEKATKGCGECFQESGAVGPSCDYLKRWRSILIIKHWLKHDFHISSLYVNYSSYPLQLYMLFFYRKLSCVHNSYDDDKQFYAHIG